MLAKGASFYSLFAIRYSLFATHRPPGQPHYAFFMQSGPARSLEGGPARPTSRIMKHAPMLILAGLALMACSPSEPAQTASNETSTTPAEPATAPPASTPAPADPAADTCNMAQYTVLVGKPSTDPGVPPASATVRIIKPGDQVTTDVMANRLNIEVDASGNITAFRCG